MRESSEGLEIYSGIKMDITGSFLFTGKSGTGKIGSLNGVGASEWTEGGPGSMNNTQKIRADTSGMALLLSLFIWKTIINSSSVLTTGKE